MDWRAYVRRRLPSLDIPAGREAEIVEELALQLEAAYDRARGAGTSHADALARAESEVPDWHTLADTLLQVERPVAARLPARLRASADAPVAGAGRGSLLTDLVQDIRYAVRSFLRAPRFTVPAVLALALGVGATSAIFSVIRGVMLEPLPYAEPDRIVTVWESNVERNRRRNVVGPANFLAWSERNRSFSHLAMIGPARVSLMLGDRPEEVSGFTASSEVFPALGVQPALGRGYTAREDELGNHEVIVISHELWQTRLGGRPDVLDTTIVVNGVPRAVIGVMPPGFTVVGQKAAFLAPYGWTIEQLRTAPGRGSSIGLARLRDGITVEQASSEMTAIAADLEREFPERNTGWSVTLVPVHEQMVEEIRPALLVLLAAVGLVLLVACVNVANLLLARSTVREREMGVRAALGARRVRLVRQMLSESLVLGAAGGVAGLVLAYAFHRGLLALVADRIPVPRLDQVALDLPVLAFTTALALGTGLLFGFVPALVASQTSIGALRDGGRHGGGPGARRTLAALVVVEVALSLVLLTGAGLLVGSFVRLQNIDPGFRASGLLTARVQLPGARYDAQATAAFYPDVLARVSALPGVQSAAGVTFLPLSGPGIGTSFYRLDRPAPGDGEAPSTQVRPVTPGFFRTMGIPQLSGREFTAGDDNDAPLVAIVSDTLARRHLPGEDPLGRRLNVSIGRAEGMDVEIVGIVGDIKMGSLDEDGGLAVYLPHAQLPIGLMTLVVRTGLEPLSLANSVAGAVHAIDPELPLADVRTMEDVVDATLARPRVVAVLLSVFGLVALLLAGVGVYGVMAYSVAQRTQELGVRMALGATPGSVFRLVLGQSLRLVLIGVGAGLVAAAGLTRLLETLLYDTAPLDPWTFGGTALLLVSVSMLASYVPARRGTRIAPVEALRAE
jgi:putative ABC transport system permease protein